MTITEESTNTALAKLGLSTPQSPQKGEVKPSPMLNVELMREIYQIATIFATSDLVPTCYRGGKGSVGLSNCFVALTMGFELGLAPFQALSHIVVVGGRPGIDGQLAIALTNRRAPIVGGVQFEEGGKGDEQYCVAWTTDRETKTRREYKLTIADAKRAGWLHRSNSHWHKDPRLMLRYRSASYLSRTHYPEATMGMCTIDELQDIGSASSHAQHQAIINRLKQNGDTGQEPEDRGSEESDIRIREDATLSQKPDGSSGDKAKPKEGEDEVERAHPPRSAQASLKKDEG